jgi:hypothetical protein
MRSIFLRELSHKEIITVKNIMTTSTVDGFWLGSSEGISTIAFAGSVQMSTQLKDKSGPTIITPKEF